MIKNEKLTFFNGLIKITSLDDWLSLEHCGKFLRILGEQSCVDEVFSRNWTDNYVEGKPNLMICHNVKDILLILLSVYIESPKLPLPSALEVLLCSEQTSFEEIELLLRRAILRPVDAGLFFTI